MSRRWNWKSNTWPPPFGQWYLKEPVGPGRIGLVRWAPTYWEAYEKTFAAKNIHTKNWRED